ncbi:MAG: hypothetical protein ABIP41_10125 [Croceibacterium sp.]
MRRTILVALVALAACKADPPPEQREAEAQHDVAMVEKANDTLPPLEPIVPDPLTAADIERYDLLGEACAYAPGTNLATRVIARPSDAFAKIGKDVERFAADPGSRELPQHSRSLYSSKNYALRLTISGAGTPSGQGKTDYEGQVELRDLHGRVVYEGAGLARCGS